MKLQMKNEDIYEKVIVNAADNADGVIITDSKGRIIYINPSAEEILKLEFNTYRGCDIHSIFPVEMFADRKMLYNVIQDVMRYNITVHLNNNLLHVDHKMAYYLICSSIIIENKSFGGVRFILRGKKVVSEKLSPLREVNQTKKLGFSIHLLDQIPIILWTTDASMNLIYVNKEAQIFSGVPYESLFGNGWMQFIHPDDRIMYEDIRDSALETREQVHY